jgi:hypothetical protein
MMSRNPVVPITLGLVITILPWSFALAGIHERDNQNAGSVDRGVLISYKELAEGSGLLLVDYGIHSVRREGLVEAPGSDTLRRFWLPEALETGWLAPDKKLHFLACYAVVLTGELASDEVETGIVAAVVLSLGKELWDLWFKIPVSERGVSKRDLVADATGIVVGAVVVAAITR